MIPDDELVMISALQHYMFCPRQCALIHIEGVWQENYLTANGRILHDKVDRRQTETRQNIRQATSLRIVSKRLGITGVADMVEFHLSDGFWHSFPIEYKNGKPKEHRADEIQLCAQAIALEEMRNEEIPEGALFYGATRRRFPVRFDAVLRKLTQDTAESVRALIQKGETPAPEYTESCNACSLKDLCYPKCRRKSAKKWIEDHIKSTLESIQL